MIGAEYVHTHKDRSLLSLGAVAVSIVLLAIGYSYGAPWYWLCGAGISLAMLVVILIRNGEWTTKICGGYVIFHHATETTRIELAHITSIKAVKWTDGPPQITLHCHDGKTIPVSPFHASTGLVEALRSAGIQIDLR